MSSDDYLELTDVNNMWTDRCKKRTADRWNPPYDLRVGPRRQIDSQGTKGGNKVVSKNGTWFLKCDNGAAFFEIVHTENFVSKFHAAWSEGTGKGLQPSAIIAAFVDKHRHSASRADVLFLSKYMEKLRPAVKKTSKLNKAALSLEDLLGSVGPNARVSSPKSPPPAPKKATGPVKDKAKATTTDKPAVASSPLAPTPVKSSPALKGPAVKSSSAPVKKAIPPPKPQNNKSKLDNARYQAALKAVGLGDQSSSESEEDVAPARPARVSRADIVRGASSSTQHHSQSKKESVDEEAASAAVKNLASASVKDPASVSVKDLSSDTVKSPAAAVTITKPTSSSPAQEIDRKTAAVTSADDDHSNAAVPEKEDDSKYVPDDSEEEEEEEEEDETEAVDSDSAKRPLEGPDMPKPKKIRRELYRNDDARFVFDENKIDSRIPHQKQKKEWVKRIAKTVSDADYFAHFAPPSDDPTYTGDETRYPLGKWEPKRATAQQTNYSRYGVEWHREVKVVNRKTGEESRMLEINMDSTWNTDAGGHETRNQFYLTKYREQRRRKIG